MEKLVYIAYLSIPLFGLIGAFFGALVGNVFHEPGIGAITLGGLCAAFQLGRICGAIR